MSAGTGSLFGVFADSPALWLSLTFGIYLAALALYRRCASHPLLLPVLTSVVVVVGLLMLTDTPYEDYAKATDFLIFLIGPATVTLAVPLYGQLGRMKRLWRPIGVAVLVGSLTAILSSIGIVWLLGGSVETLLSVAPKSATMPIAIEVSYVTQGLPSFTTVAVAITGICGAVLTGTLLRLIGIKDPVVKGFTLGMSAHAIGTARAFQVGDTAGAFSALGMSLNGIATAVLVPLVLALFGLF